MGKLLLLLCVILFYKRRRERQCWLGSLMCFILYEAIVMEFLTPILEFFMPHISSLTSRIRSDPLAQLILLVLMWRVLVSAFNGWVFYSTLHNVSSGESIEMLRERINCAEKRCDAFNRVTTAAIILLAVLVVFAGAMKSDAYENCVL